MVNLVTGKLEAKLSRKGKVGFLTVTGCTVKELKQQVDTDVGIQKGSIDGQKAKRSFAGLTSAGIEAAGRGISGTAAAATQSVAKGTARALQGTASFLSRVARGGKRTRKNRKTHRKAKRGTRRH